TYKKLDEVIFEVDVLMMLRIQFERHRNEARHIETEAAYLRDYGLNQRRYHQLKDHAIVMHPAPVNRDVEIASGLVESEKARIVRQMENGVFRSEEHTSELQSRFDLVCRLLLEKK